MNQYHLYGKLKKEDIKALDYETMQTRVILIYVISYIKCPIILVENIFLSFYKTNVII